MPIPLHVAQVIMHLSHLRYLRTGFTVTIYNPGTRRDFMHANTHDQTVYECTYIYSEISLIRTSIFREKSSNYPLLLIIQIHTFGGIQLMIQ